jgi:pimeloyl-ACP methyl ester carboxylesterase
VQGERENAVSPPDVIRAWERLSERPVAVIPGTHMPYLSFPQEFNAVVEAFLTSSETAG